jgi:hypothetical protein
MSNEGGYKASPNIASIEGMPPKRELNQKGNCLNFSIEVFKKTLESNELIWSEAKSILSENINCPKTIIVNKNNNKT